MAGVFRPSVLLAIVCFYRVVLSDEPERDSLNCRSDQKPCMTLKKCILMAEKCPCAKGEEHCDSRGEPTTTSTRPLRDKRTAESTRPLGHRRTAESSRPLGHKRTTESSRPLGHKRTTESSRPLGHRRTTESSRPHGHKQTTESSRPLGHRRTTESSRPLGHKRTTESSRPLGHRRTTESSRPHGQKRSTESSRPLGHRRTTESSRPLGHKQTTESSRPLGHRRTTESSRPLGHRRTTESSRPLGHKQTTESSRPHGQKRSTESSRPLGHKRTTESSRPLGHKRTTESSRPLGHKRTTESSRPLGHKRTTESSRPLGQKQTTESSRRPSKEVCPDGRDGCTPKPSGGLPKKDNYFFIGSMFPNKEYPGKFLGDVVEDLGSSSAVVESVLNNVNGNWQVQRLKTVARKEKEWVDVSKGMKISGKDKLRFKPSNHMAHGFDEIRLKSDASKYIGVIVYPCVTPKLVVKKTLSGIEDTPLRFNLDQVVDVTRAPPKKLSSNLVGNYKFSIPKAALVQYERLLKQPLGASLGVLVEPSEHGEVNERRDGEEESKPVRRPPGKGHIIKPKPKIFPSGSSLVFKPKDDYFGKVELKVVPVDLSPNTKDLKSVFDRCAFGKDSIISIEIASVNDKPTARKDPRKDPVLVIDAPPLPYELKKHSDNEGFKVGRLAMRVGEDKDRDRLGIAVVVFNKRKHIGEWQYLDSNSLWQTIDVNGSVNDDALIMGENAQPLFLPPGQNLRFKPSELTKLWSATEQMEHTALRFILWDQTDKLELGVNNITLKGNSAISAKVITCTIGRMGCDGKKNSRRKKNECGECGKKSCRKCDGDRESSAKLNHCGHCVLGKTGKSEDYGMDCMGICKGTYKKGKCGCHKPGDVSVDCAGTCDGAARIQICPVCSEDEDAGKDACGVCNGDNSTCLGCDGVPKSGKVIDRCDVCRSPKAADFNTGCVSIGDVSPKSFAKGVEQELKVDGAGFPKKGIECELRSSGRKVAASRILSETGKSMKLSMPAINDVGKYKLSCTIGGVVHKKEDFAVAVYDKQELTVTKVEPNEIDEGSNVAEVLVTGTGFMDTGDLFCVYKAAGDEKSDRTVPSSRLARKAERRSLQTSCEKPRKRARAEFISSTQVKCKVSEKTCPVRVDVSVVLSQDGRMDSSVPLTWYARAPAVDRYAMGKRSNTRIHVIFDRSVARLQGCDRIFTSETVTKLTELADKGKPRCYFPKPEELVIIWRGEDMKTDINLKFKSGVIKADEAFSRTSALELTVRAVVKKVVPIAVITAPSQVGLCGQIKISGKNSKKTGRKVFRCKWTVNVSDEDALSEEHKTDLANVRNQAHGCVFTIEQQYLKQGIRYTFSLVVVSLGVESEPVSHAVERLEKNVPTVRLVKKLKTFDMSKAKLAIRVRAKRPTCLRDSSVKFLWNCSSHSDLVLGADRKSYLSLPRPVNKVTCGGKLIYMFSCTAEDGQVCLVKNSEGELKSFKLRGGENPSIKVNASHSIANKTYTFKLEVFKTGKHKTESSASSVKITIVLGRPPAVKLKMSKRNDGKLIIIAKVKTSFDKTKFKWKCVEEPGYGTIDPNDNKIKRAEGVINRPASKSKKQKRSTNTKQEDYSKTLLLPFGSTTLEPGVPYTFRLIAYSEQEPDNVGESRITITTNAPPTQGELNVEPQEGKSHNTTFICTASNFYDNSTISYKFFYEKRDKNGVVKKKPLPFNGERSAEVQLPSGDDEDDGKITLVVEARDEEGATTSARVKIKCSRTQIKSEDVDRQIDAVNGLSKEGESRLALAFGVSVLTDVAKQPDIQEKSKELQESIAAVASDAMDQADNTNEMKLIIQLLPDVNPSHEDSKRRLSSSLTDLVTKIVPKNVKKQSGPEQTEGTRSSRQRRAAEDEPDADEEDEESSGMTSDEVENVLATFENLVDTTVVNNVTRNFLETVDNLLIAMCKNLQLGETSIALSALGTLRSDMNYMDDVDQAFLNVSCSNCSSPINHTALVKFGSELKSLYNEWQCSGSDELCNGVCAAMVQYPYDFITADNSSTRRSDVVFVELKNPETLDHIPIEGLTLPALLRIPLHRGSSESAGYQCKIWNNSLAQWSTSGCQKTQVFSQDETVFVDCSCSRLGFTVVHAAGGGGGGGGGGGTGAPPTTNLSTESTVEPSASGNGTQTTESPRLTASVTFSFDVDYDSFVTDPSVKDQLENTVEETLADVMHVDTSLILNVTISEGSIVVNFILLSPVQNPSLSLNYSITQLQLAVNKGEFIVTLNDGEVITLTAENGTVGYSYRMISGIQADSVITKTKEDEEGSKLPLILACVFGVVLLLVIVAVILYRRHVAKNSKVSHKDVKMSQAIKNNCAENTAYQGSVGKDMDRPVTPGKGAPQTTTHGGSAADLETSSTAMEETAGPEAQRPSTAGSQVGSGNVRRNAELPGVE